jgi:hypothetical protein
MTTNKKKGPEHTDRISETPVQKLRNFSMEGEAFCFHHQADYHNLITHRNRLSLGDRLSRFYMDDGVLEILLEENIKKEDELDFRVNFRIPEGTIRDASAGVSLSVKNWSDDAYLLLPAAAYNGNRFESRKISYSPKLLDEKDLWPQKEIIVSDIPRLNIFRAYSELRDRSGSLSAPLILMWLPLSSEILVIQFDHANELGDTALIITENKDRTRLKIHFQSPVVREKNIYKICNNSFPTPDVPYDFSEGDEFTMSFSVKKFPAKSIAGIFSVYPSLVMFSGTKKDEIVNTPLLKECFELVEEKFNNQNWVEEWGYYSVGMRENFLQDWQVGWTGGMISTFPLFLSGGEKSRKRVLRNFEWFFRDGFSPSGLPWDSGEKGRFWYGGDIRRDQTKNRHLSRKSADAIYYIYKQFFIFRKEGIDIPDLWKEKMESLCRVFVNNWKQYGDVGQFLDTENASIVVGGSTSAAILPAGLVLAYRWTGKQEFLEISMEIANYFFENYLSKGISCGGPGDALQNPDSESSYALCESFILIYEETRDAEWLRKAETAAGFFSTWVMSYNYGFPIQSTHGKLNLKTEGLVFANTQNKHLAPGICTHSGSALLNIYRYSGNEKWMNLLESVVRAMPAYLSTKERPIEGLQPGWVSERVNSTDWLEDIGETMKGSTWAETSLMLAAVEIPSLYINSKEKKAWCFDQLDYEIRSDSVVLYKMKKQKDSFKIKILREIIPETGNLKYDEAVFSELEISDYETIVSF